MADPVVEIPQTAFYNTPDPVLAGERWAAHPHFRHESCTVPLTAYGVESGQIFKFTVSGLNGTPLGVEIGGATYIAATPTTDATLVSQLNAKLGSFATASSPDANTLWIAVADPQADLTATVYSPGTPDLTPLAGTTSSYVGTTQPGRLVSWAAAGAGDDDQTLIRRYAAGSVVAGAALREGLPSATESTLRRAPIGGHPDGRSFLVAMCDYVSLEASGPIGLQGPIYVVHTPASLAGTLRGDDGGTAEVKDVTVTPSATDLVGFSFGGLAPLQVTSVDLATDRANLILEWKARPDYLAIGPAPTVVGGKLRVVSGSSGSLPAFVNVSDAPAATSIALVTAGAAATADLLGPSSPVRVYARRPCAAGEAFPAEIAQ